MSKKRILSQLLTKQREIKIITLYILIAFGIVITAYINNLYKYQQHVFQGAENTVLPIPNVEFLLNPPSKSFELSFFRFHDIKMGRKFIQMYIHVKLRSIIQAKKEIRLKSQVNIMKSGWNRGYAGSIVENERLDINLICCDKCGPQMIFDYKIPSHLSDYMISIEVLNSEELYNQGIEAFTTGVVTGNWSFDVKVTIMKISFYIMSVIGFLLGFLSLGNAHDSLYFRVFALLGVIGNSQHYLIFNGRIRILIKEALLTTHITLLANLWIHSIENIINKKYSKLKKVILLMIAATSFLVYHSLWNPPFIISSCLLGLWAIFILISNCQKITKSAWEDGSLFLIVSTYFTSYMFIMIRGNFDFLGDSEFNLLFYMINSLFTIMIVIINSASTKKLLSASSKLSSKEYTTVDVTVENQYTTKV